MAAELDLATKYGRKPDFENLKLVLQKKVPSRPTLFEFFLNEPIYSRAAWPLAKGCSALDVLKRQIAAFGSLGYDYVTLGSWEISFSFKHGEQKHGKTVSLNEGFLITDRASFESYEWPNLANVKLDLVETAAQSLRDGQKYIASGPGGLLENVVQLVGYDNLCFMLADDPGLVGEISCKIGSILEQYYALIAKLPCVGACIVNDDWGFKTQTMIAPADMRKYIFPWEKRMVAAIHAAGKLAILHSCGYAGDIMEDIIGDMRFDGKHSYEDTIQPVEEAYRHLAGRIAVLGGIDLDFVCRSTPAVIRERSLGMLKLAEGKGGYALGTGNSVPEYVPTENYLAMAEAALSAGK